MQDHTQALLAQVASLGDLVRDQTPLIEAKSRLLLTTPEIFGLRQVVVTGSGDSYFAAEAAVPLIRALTGLPAVALKAMEASRYLSLEKGRFNPGGTLVLIVSSSGESARVIEAAQRLVAAGALVVAVTAKPESRLGQAATRALDVSVPPAPPAVGTRSYVASLLGCYLMGIRIAEVLLAITMDEANALRNEIAALGAPMRGLPDELRPAITRLAQEWAASDGAIFLGSGPSIGSAAYAAAKVIETAGVNTNPQDIEEFHHLEFFVGDPARRPAMAFTSIDARALSRVRELIGALDAVGRPYAICSDGDLGIGARQIFLPKVREAFAPLLHTIPAAMLAAYWGEHRAERPFRGSEGPWAASRDAVIVRKSDIILD